MTSHLHHMYVDRTTIKTRLTIHPDLFDTPNAFFHKHDIPIRTSKPTTGTSKRGPTRNLTLDVLTYGGIKIELRKVAGDPLTYATIHFTPSRCLYGHNGYVLSLVEFLDALGILTTNLEPLLSNPDDWVDLIPGLKSGGRAYWHYLESQFQCSDQDGTLLAAFRHARHPKIRTLPRQWPESIEFGGKHGQLQIGIYRKAVEMVAHGKLDPVRLDDFRHALRLEVRLRGDKLAHYFSNERNVEIIDDMPRLVRFYSRELVAGQRECFSAFEGIFSSDEPLPEVSPNETNTLLGRLLARVALVPPCPKTFPELVDNLKFYTGASWKTAKDIREAGFNVLSHRSPISKDGILSDEAYERQCQVGNEELEREVRHDIEDTYVHRLISEAYRPPDQPFQPMTQWPSYLRF